MNPGVLESVLRVQTLYLDYLTTPPALSLRVAGRDFEDLADEFAAPDPRAVFSRHMGDAMGDA